MAMVYRANSAVLLLGVLAMALPLSPRAEQTSAPDAAQDATPAVPLVIAHRGASGYLPEHSLAAYAFAYAQGADYLEPDVVITRDGQAIALHDLTLDATTNVREVFPGRAREDGLNYVVDFTLEEIRQLRMFERIESDTGEQRYPARFPAELGDFRVVTLAELIELTQGLNASTGREVGIYPETKFPAFHAEHGHDIAAIIVEVLERYGYREAEDRAIIQSFEPEPLERLREQGVRLRLVQLLGENAWGMNEVDYEPMYTAEGLAAIARYADGIGPPISRIIVGTEASGAPQFSTLVADAHAAGLVVHPFTLRTDVLPEGVSSDELLYLLLEVQRVDGLFIDQPDAMVEFLRLLRSPQHATWPRSTR